MIQRYWALTIWNTANIKLPNKTDNTQIYKSIKGCSPEFEVWAFVHFEMLTC